MNQIAHMLIYTQTSHTALNHALIINSKNQVNEHLLFTRAVNTRSWR